MNGEVWGEMQICTWSSWCHCHSLSLASAKSILVLPFWYWLTWIIPDKEPLNGCCCLCCFQTSGRPVNTGRHVCAKIKYWRDGCLWHQWIQIITGRVTDRCRWRTYGVSDLAGAVNRTVHEVILTTHELSRHATRRLIQHTPPREWQ